MRHKEKPAVLRVALIGLIGTLLTVCGGLAGALISANVTIWQRDQSVQVLGGPAGICGFVSGNPVTLGIEQGRRPEAAAPMPLMFAETEVPMTRLAILSDTHGNLPALEAVLADIARQGQPDFYWVLGDLVAFFPWPNETLARLRALPNVSFLQGNTDRYLVTGRRPLAPVRSPEDWARMSGFLEMRDALFRWTVGRLSWEEYLFLRDLPTRLEMEIPGYGRVVAVHAVPGDDETNILPDTPDEQIIPYLSGLDARLLVYGHTHRPLDREVGGVRLVNGGSVGVSLDGDPRAAYALLDFSGPECTVSLRRVAYDVEGVVAELERVEHPARLWLASMLRRAAAP